MYRLLFFVMNAAVFVAHQLMQKILAIRQPFADSYLDDIVAMPIILSLLMTEKNWRNKKPLSRPLNNWYIIATTIYLAFVAEVAFPYFSRRFTPDIWDVACYGLGSFLFYLLQKLDMANRSAALIKHN